MGNRFPLRMDMRRGYADAFIFPFYGSGHGIT